MSTDEDKKPPPAPPEGLKVAGVRFWTEILYEYDFPGSPEMFLLIEEAARTADVVARLQHVVDSADTLRTKGSRNQDVAIPELDALRAYRAQFAALVRQLNLPGFEDDQTGDGGPMTRSEAGTKAADARWRGRR